MIKLILLIFFILLAILILTKKIANNLFENQLLRYFSYIFIILCMLLTVLLARYESVDGIKGKYTPPYYDGKKINPGKVEYE